MDASGAREDAEVRVGIGRWLNEHGVFVPSTHELVHGPFSIGPLSRPTTGLSSDTMFVTARHTLQSLWKVGTAGPKQQALVVERLAGRFADCAPEKNWALIRYDIIVDLGQLYDAVGDESIKARALALIETEPDLKYRKKYSTVFKLKKKP